jgi:S-methylmethionine-dependent homocysteine/selenocysteine methylase
MSGADVITTNNYTTTPDILSRAGLGHRFQELTTVARDLAMDAKAKSGRKGARIAGSLPPLISSYRPDLVMTPEKMRPIYDEMAGILAPGVDLFICETMSSATEARTAAQAGLAAGKPVWVSWTLEDETYNGRLRSGETIAQALAALDGLDVEAVLFNCTPPEAIDIGLPELRPQTKRKIGAYANAFLPVPKKWLLNENGLNKLRGDVDADMYGAFAQRWLNDGIDIMGGCCGIGPEHIRKIRDMVDAKG